MIRAFAFVAGFLLATAASAEETERLSTTGGAAGIGVLGTAYSSPESRWGDLSIAPSVEARYVLGGLLLDGAVLAEVPTAGGGPAFGLNAVARVGYAGQRWLADVGAVIQWGTPGVDPPIQVLPSVHGAYSFGAFALEAGLFDLYGLAPFQLSVDFGNFSVGYVALLGGRAAYAFRLGDVALRAQAMVFSLFNSQVAFVSVSATFGGIR